MIKTDGETPRRKRSVIYALYTANETVLNISVKRQ